MMPSMGDWVLFLLRWFHFLAGITWIGMLYYFNFVQTPFFGSKFVADNAAVRSGIVRGGLLDTALWWFRWGAMLTFLTGVTYIIETSPNAQTWTPAGASKIEEISSTPTGDGVTSIVILRVKPAVTAPAHTAEFIRLRVTTQ